MRRQNLPFQSLYTTKHNTLCAGISLILAGHFVSAKDYKKAVELTLEADILLLIGGMLPYYAASKLMGLLVSKRGGTRSVTGVEFIAMASTSGMF